MSQEPLWLTQAKQERKAQQLRQVWQQAGTKTTAAAQRLSDGSKREQTQQQAIDVLLADQPEDFKATVFELCRQLGWPDDEPGFLLAIVSNRLYALAKEYPQRLSKAMQGATKDTLEQWQDLQAQLNSTMLKQDLAMARLYSQTTQMQQVMMAQRQQAEQVFEREQRAMLAALETERAAIALTMEQERSAMAAAAQQQVEAQKAVLKEETSAVLATVAQQRAAEHGRRGAAHRQSRAHEALSRS